MGKISRLFTGKRVVTLVDPGYKKVNVIKEIRRVTGWGLKECVVFIENTPSSFDPMQKEDAAELELNLIGAGATVSVK
jgi:ribosomal protein L7/L12